MTESVARAETTTHVVIPDTSGLGACRCDAIRNPWGKPVTHRAAHCERARAHGAKILSEPADFPYGERQYTAEDPAGHQWTFSETFPFR